jgi:hypothetical protein
MKCYFCTNELHDDWEQGETMLTCDNVRINQLHFLQMDKWIGS